MAKVLVVDDHPINRKLIVTLLRHVSHEALEASDGEEALAIVRREHPQLVISDILMPTMDGYEFVRQLRTHPDVAATQVIFHTASYHGHEARKLAEACGVTRILPKPSERSQILQVIEEALGNTPQIAPTVVPEGFDHEHLRLVGDKLSQKVEDLQAANQRLGAMGDLNLQLASEGNLHALLIKVCRGARDLVGARRALAVVGDRDEGITRHVATSGMDSAAATRLGTPLMREGPMGLAFDHRKSSRMVNPGGDPVLLGLPVQYPPVHAMVVAPIVSLGHAYGWICLTDKLGAAEFSGDDENVLAVLAALVGRVYESGSLFLALEESAATIKASAEALSRAQKMAGLAHGITGAEGEFLQWSENLPRMIGVEATAMPANTRDWLMLIHPDDRAQFRRAAIVAGRTGIRAEAEYRVASGSGWAHLRQIMEPDAANAAGPGARRWFSTIQDVTEQHRASRAVLEAERKFRAIFENSVLGILQTRTDGTVITVNPAAAQMLGYASPREFLAEVRDLGTQVYADPHDRERFLQQLRATSVVQGFETRFWHKGGGTIWVSLSARLENDQAGGPEYLLGSVQDITERKAQEERIARLSRVSAVLSGINSLIVRVGGRQELFDESCRIAIEVGKFSKAWIATTDVASGGLAMAACRGMDAGFVETLMQDINATLHEGRTLASRAVLERKPAAANDIRSDPEILRRAENLASGTRAMIALPLVIDDQAVGLMMLHTDESDFFDADEIALLSELAGDIAFALDHLEKVARADYLVFYDQLTGLPNRRLFSDRLALLLGATSAEKPNVAVACVDINRFSMINDSLGRDAGDVVLKALAARFTATLANLGTAARTGADSFTVAVPGKWDAAGIARGQDTFYPALFDAPIAVAGQQLVVTGTVGLAFSPADGTSADMLIGNAEAALKLAKAGGERMMLYNSEMNARVGDTLAIEGKLRQAIARQEFVLHYQPKITLDGGAIVGVEALIRWQSPELGLVPPVKFISLLEQTGMILEVGAWALQRAASDHRAWSEMGLVTPRVAVNVSAIQLRQRDFAGEVKRAIAGGVSPPAIDLEITESLVMEDIQDNIAKLQELRDSGVAIAIDDFGTGYSSLAYLARLPVAALKIDRSFIIAMIGNPDTMTLVKTIISLAHAYRLTVIAEGVDEEAQAEVLRALGCDQMQGYLFSKPLPFEAMTVLLRGH